MRFVCEPLWVLIVLATSLSASAFAAEIVGKSSPDTDRCERQTIGSGTGGALESFRDCKDSPIMIELPAGRFQMGDAIGVGSAYESPVHEVRLAAFALARFETTREQWLACERAGACKAARSDGSSLTAAPIENVTWEQVQDYVAWLSQRSGQRYRLPSEAEWEYAARAGTVTQYTWGNSLDGVCAHANGFDRSGHRENPQWYWQSDCDDGHAKAAPVGRFPPNAWGLHDMLGNVWEWVGDCWHSDYTNAPADGRAWTDANCRKRVNRGGGWGNPATTLRVTNRDGDPPNARSEGLGFRVARDMPSR